MTTWPRSQTQLPHQRGLCTWWKDASGPEVVRTIKRLKDGMLLYPEGVHKAQDAGNHHHGKYPGTTDFDTVANSVLPSNARSDTGDVRIVRPECRARQTDPGSPTSERPSCEA